MNTGAMIASKVAAMVPERVLSLALLNVTGGGFECLPKVFFFFLICFTDQLGISYTPLTIEEC